MRSKLSGLWELRQNWIASFQRRQNGCGNGSTSFLNIWIYLFLWERNTKFRLNNINKRCSKVWAKCSSLTQSWHQNLYIRFWQDLITSILERILPTCSDWRIEYLLIYRSNVFWPLGTTPPLCDIRHRL